MDRKQLIDEIAKALHEIDNEAILRRIYLIITVMAGN